MIERVKCVMVRFFCAMFIVLLQVGDGLAAPGDPPPMPSKYEKVLVSSSEETRVDQPVSGEKPSETSSGHGFWSRFYTRKTIQSDAAEPTVTNVPSAAAEEPVSKPGFWSRFWSSKPAVTEEPEIEEAEKPVVQEPSPQEEKESVVQDEIRCFLKYRQNSSQEEKESVVQDSVPAGEGYWSRFWGWITFRKVEPAGENIESTGEGDDTKSLPENAPKPAVGVLLTKGGNAGKEEQVVVGADGVNAGVAKEDGGADLPHLRPGLVLKVVVMASGRKEVDEEAKRITTAGSITLPLIGSINVDNMTTEDLAKKLTTLYSAYLRNPMVDVDFVVDAKSGNVSPWGFVTVLGRVKQPGRINIPPTRDLTLSMAVQLAGGLDTSAKLTGIKITREVDGKPLSFDVNLESVGAKGETKGDVSLRLGDIIYVPERVF